MTTPFQTTGYTGDKKTVETVGNLINAGANLISQPYPQYNEAAAKQYANFVPNLVAPQTPYQINAAQGMAGLQGYTLPFTQQALQYASNAGTPINYQSVGESQINKYMSPYLNNVVNAAVQNINETNAQQQQQLAGNAIAKGAWGGDRAGIAQAQLARQQNLANNATLANILNTGYGTALGEANVQQQQDIAAQLYNRQLANAAAAQMQNLGTTSQNAQIQQQQAQYNMGAAMQAQNQNEKSAAYQQYLNANQSPYNQLNWYANLISGAPAALGGQTVATIPQPNTVSQLGGLATTIASGNLGGLFGGSTTGSTGAKRGGAIRPGYATGGRPKYADGGFKPIDMSKFFPKQTPQASNVALSSDPTQAYNAYINASRSGTASLADLNSLYANLLNAQRGNASQGVAGVANPYAAYPALPLSGFTPAQAAAINATASNTPQSIAATPGQTGSAKTGALAAAGGALALLSKLFGGGDSKGKSSGETFNKRESVRGGQNLTTDKQDELNNQAEYVNDKMILLADAHDKKQISEEDFQKQYNELSAQFAKLYDQGARIEPRKGTTAEEAAAIKSEKDNPANAGVAPLIKGNENKPSLENLKKNENVTDASGVLPAASNAVVDSSGYLPVGMVDPENAVEFAKNNGLINASLQDLQASGLSPDAIKAVLDYQQSPAAAQAMNVAEMAMQPSQPTATQNTGEDPEAVKAYEQYIKMGFSPEEASTAVSANTSSADKKGLTPEEIQKMATDAKKQLETGYQDSLNKLNNSYSSKLDELLNQKNQDIAALGAEPPKTWIPSKYYAEQPNPAYYTWLNNVNAINAKYDYSKNAYLQSQTAQQNALQDNYQTAQNNAQNQINDMYKSQGADLGNAYDSSSQYLQDVNNLGYLPTVENIMQYESALPTTFEDFSQYGASGTLSDFNDQFGGTDSQPLDTSTFTPPETDFTKIDYTNFEPPPVVNMPGSDSSSSSSGTVNYWDDEEEEKRGGRIHPHYYHGGYVNRQRRALGGPNVPQAGVHPISMEYGLNTQDYMKQLAQSQLGSGVAPITSGQEALAATYLLGNG